MLNCVIEQQYFELIEATKGAHNRASLERYAKIYGKREVVKAYQAAMDYQAEHIVRYTLAILRNKISDPKGDSSINLGEIAELF